jgi:hypothetical protein
MRGIAEAAGSEAGVTALADMFESGNVHGRAIATGHRWTQAIADTDQSRLRIAIVCSKKVNELQHHGSRRIRLDLMNGMHIAVLTTVAYDPRTMLSVGLAPQRLSPLRRSHQCFVDMSVLPVTL